VCAVCGVRVEVIAADLSDVDAPGLIADKVKRLGIDVDLLVNNAAVGYSGKFFSRPIHEELIPITVNVHSLVALTHLFGKRMVERGSGGIINISSDAGRLTPLLNDRHFSTAEIHDAFATVEDVATGKVVVEIEA
jgi:short-subunit dehydrogenase